LQVVRPPRFQVVDPLHSQVVDLLRFLVVRLEVHQQVASQQVASLLVPSPEAQLPAVQAMEFGSAQRASPVSQTQLHQQACNLSIGSLVQRLVMVVLVVASCPASYPAFVAFQLVVHQSVA
jgi:hypothetical protein